MREYNISWLCNVQNICNSELRRYMYIPSRRRWEMQNKRAVRWECLQSLVTGPTSVQYKCQPYPSATPSSSGYLCPLGSGQSRDWASCKISRHGRHVNTLKGTNCLFAHLGSLHASRLYPNIKESGTQKLIFNLAPFCVLVSDQIIHLLLTHILYMKTKSHF